MKKIYGDEFVKALMSMISNRNFNRDIEKSYGWWDIKLKSSDLDAFFKYIDFDKKIKINSIELEMLTGTLDSIKFLEYYDKEETISNYELTSLDLLLYASLKNEVVFDKLLNIKDINYSNIVYTLYQVLIKGDLEKAKYLISKGANLNSTYPGGKCSIVEICLIGNITSLLRKEIDVRTKAKNIVSFIIKNKELVDATLFKAIDEILENNIKFINDFYNCNIEKIDSIDIFSNIENFIEKTNFLD